MDSSRPHVKQEATAAPANNQLEPCNPISQPRIRTNSAIVKPLRFYIPDDDASVPYAFMLGQHTVTTAGGCRGALLSGYFSALCAVLPDRTNLAKKIMGNLGFQAEEISVPSQAERMGIVVPQSQDLTIEVIKFAQMLFLPFQIRFDSEVCGMWEAVARDVGARDVSSVMVCSVDDMKTISTALAVSGQDGGLRSSIASSMENLIGASSPFGYIISKAKKQAVEPNRYCHRVSKYRTTWRDYTLYEGL